MSKGAYRADATHGAPNPPHAWWPALIIVGARRVREHLPRKRRGNTHLDHHLHHGDRRCPRLSSEACFARLSPSAAFPKRDSTQHLCFSIANSGFQKQLCVLHHLHHGVIAHAPAHPGEPALGVAAGEAVAHRGVSEREGEAHGPGGLDEALVVPGVGGGGGLGLGRGWRGRGRGRWRWTGAPTSAAERKGEVCVGGRGGLRWRVGTPRGG